MLIGGVWRVQCSSFSGRLAEPSRDPIEADIEAQNRALLSGEVADITSGHCVANTVAVRRYINALKPPLFSGGVDC